MQNRLKLALFTSGGLMLFAALLLLLTPARPAAALGGWEVVAGGLTGVYHIAVADDGTLYIGDAALPAPPAAPEAGGGCIPNPEDPDQDNCIAQTGIVWRVPPGGAPEIMADDLYSIVTYTDTVPVGASGPTGIAVDPNGEVYVVIGLGADPTEREAAFGADGVNLGQLVHVMSDGTWENVADVAAYEGTDNPDGDILDSNPYGLLMMGAETALVVDAGGNDLLNVAVGDGTITTHTVFPTRTVDNPFPPPPPTIDMQSVPTSVAMDSGGMVYVGELTGFPFPAGGANVYHVMEGGEPMVHESGFTNITDIAVDADDNLYVLEFATNSILSEDPTGAIIKVEPDGTRSTILNTPCTFDPTAIALCLATGMAVGPDGMLYVVNFGLVPGLAQVVRFDPDVPLAVNLSSLDATGGAAVEPAAVALAGFVTAAGLLVALRRRYR